MASIIIDNYHIYYSIIDGKIYEFEKFVNGKWIPADNEQELITVANKLIKIQQNGYSAFIYKLAKEGKVVIPVDRHEAI